MFLELNKQHKLKLTHEKMEKNEKAIAAWTLLTPIPSCGVSDFPH